MSRAKEIQEKLALQTKLQLSFRNTNSKVLSWLDNEDSTTLNDPQTVFTKAEFEDSRQAFYRLPVVQIGAGLHFDNVDNHTEAEAEADDIHTVGEFINSDKKVSSLSKKKRRRAEGSGTEYGNRQQSDSIYRVAKNDTKAMVALKRKMRKTHRENIRAELAQGSSSSSSNGTGRAVVNDRKTSTVTTRLNSYNHRHNHNHNDSDSSDSDDGRSKRKQIGLLFQSKKKKK